MSTAEDFSTLFLFFYSNDLSKVICSLFLAVGFPVHLHRCAAEIGVLCSTLVSPKPRHESEAEDETAEALWLSALGASTSAAGGARKWKLL